MTAGSYPNWVLFVNSFVQVIALLTFSAFADYGNYRKVLLRWSTYACSFCLILVVFCSSGSMVWLAGLLRILMGCCFVQTNVYYNAYLPLLTSQCPEVLELIGEKADKKQEEVSDSMSSKGAGCGYCGGTTMQIVAGIIFLLFQCDKSDIGDTCTEEQYEFDRVFWIGFCIALCGIWWLVFSTYTFANLKERAGGPFPPGANIWCLGWQKAREALVDVYRLRNTFLYVIGYFIWSDSLATVVNVATQDVDGDSGQDADAGKDSSKLILLTGATFCVLIGVFAILGIQHVTKASSKTVLLIQLCIYGIVSTGAAMGFLKSLNGMGYYLCLIPMMLMLGSLQAFQRSLYSSLSPVGKEAKCLHSTRSQIKAPV